MLATVLGLQVYFYTKDDFALGLIGLAEVIPFFMAALFGGVMADNLDRKSIIVTMTSIYGVCVLLLLLLNLQFTQLFQLQTAFYSWGIGYMYAVIFITGIVRGFLAPAQSAFMPQIIDKSLYGQAAIWNSMMWHLSAILGPAVGALLYAKTGAVPTYTLMSVFALIGILFYIAIPKQIHPKTLQKADEGEGIFQKIGEGLHFVFRQPIMLSATALDMFAVLFGGAVVMLPSFADRVLHVGEEGVGILRAAPAVGALLMAGLMTYRSPLRQAGRNLLLSVAGFGLMIILFALSTNFYLSIVALTLMGAFDNISVVVRSTILQLYTPDDMRGRVSAVNSMFISTSNELGAFESGLAARLLGLVPSVVFGGSITILVVAATYYLAPVMRTLNLERELKKK